MKKTKGGEIVLREYDEEKWVYDSSFDHKGRVPLRASTGAWKASLFIIAIEFSERLSYFGLGTSLIIYLSRVLHQDLKTAARNVNYWGGVTTVMPLLGGFLADAYIGRFSTVLASSIVYLMGLLLLTMSRVIPSLKPCDRGSCHNSGTVHEIVFFVAIYLVSIGTGGHKPALESFGADQFDDDHPLEKKQKMSYFNWWGVGLCSGLLLGVTLIVYIQDHVGWDVADIIITISMAASLLVFCLGRPFYRFRKPNGSPLKPMLQVLVASFTKRNLPHPSDSSQLYEISESEHKHGRLLAHTNKLKSLDKAAIIDEKQSLAEQKKNSWKLSTVTEVEETKLLINMIPIWITTLPFGICVAQASTFFIKQGTTLNRKIGHSFELPAASIYAFTAIGMILSVTVYDVILVPFLRKVTRNERGMSILQRIGFGMIFSIATMIVAAVVERKRLDIVTQNMLIEANPLKRSASMSVFWLVPQFLIIGMGDAFTLVGLQEYFYDQVPDSMRSLGIAFYLSVIGAANFISSLLITIVDHITSRTGSTWIGKDLNSSHLDYFYWLLASITSINLVIYVLVARQYSYKNVHRKANVVVNCSDSEAIA
ncbi:transporter [Lithospermum erythrorhizon]|uniref:Transporter n=1 Tax=Lithospermum erythrorhizon TaxID=34254 RepID=A0AAV3P6C5_LITER